jgi:hypothetical protein
VRGRLVKPGMTIKGKGFMTHYTRQGAVLGFFIETRGRIRRFVAVEQDETLKRKEE